MAGFPVQRLRPRRVRSHLNASVPCPFAPSLPAPAALRPPSCSSPCRWSPSSGAANGDATKLTALRETLAKEGYIEPPAEVAKLVTAPRHLVVSLSATSPDRKYFLKEQSEGLPSVQTYGKAHLYFGGLQVDPKANRARIFTSRGATGAAAG